MIDMRFVVLPDDSNADYVRVGGKRCQLQYRVRLDKAGWWIPVQIQEQKPDDKMQPFWDVPGMTDAQRLEAHDFHKTLEGR